MAVLSISSHCHCSPTTGEGSLAKATSPQVPLSCKRALSTSALRLLAQSPDPASSPCAWPLTQFILKTLSLPHLTPYEPSKLGRVTRAPQMSLTRKAPPPKQIAWAQGSSQIRDGEVS